MPELSSIQTYEKLNGNDIKPSIIKFAKVLELIGVWNSDLKKQFELLEWVLENNGFAYPSNSNFGFHKTELSKIKIRPQLLLWTPAIGKTFNDNWISCELLIETKSIRNYKYGNYNELTFEFIKKLVKEMAIEFDDTGVYFTDEAQDGKDFDGIRSKDQNNLWNFDYALISKNLKGLYEEKPKNYKINETDNWIESWNSDNWNEIIKNENT